MLMIAPEVLEPPQVLKIGEKLQWKYNETRFFVSFNEKYLFYHYVLALILSKNNLIHARINMKIVEVLIYHAVISYYKV